MIERNIFTYSALLVVIVTALFPLGAKAQGSSLTLTVTPPLYQVTQVAGSDWHSQLRVVNSNNYDIFVTIKTQDFHPDGETGNAVFDEIPKGDPNDPHRISGWIDVPSGILTIKRGSTVEIPFSVHVPEKADPGGHYGALLVSTNPGEIEGGSGAGISSGITSLIFLRVPGDVIEKGSIRDFYTEDNVIETPRAHFIMRFENQGNVHIVPQGEIVITNMWGKVRGKVSINESSTFGNVLPASTRKFEFVWNEIDPSPLEVGRYKAVATIVYGVEGRQTVERIVYFWIVPWKPVSAILGSILFFIWFISWSVRRYIRKALQLEGQYRKVQDKTIGETAHISSNAQPMRTHELTLKALRRPLQEVSYSSVAELTQEKEAYVGSTQKTKKHKSQFAHKLKRNRPIIIFVSVLLLGIGLISWYFVEVFQDERAYHVEQIRPR